MIENITPGAGSSSHVDPKDTALEALVAGTRGDFASQCMLAMSNASSCEYRMGIGDVKHEQQQRLELKKHLEKFIEQQKDMEDKSGLMRFISKVAGGILAVAGAIASVYSGPAGFAITMVGVGLVGGFEVAGAHFDRFAIEANVGQLRTQNRIDFSTAQQSDTMSALKTLVEAEKKMSQRLVEFSENRHNTSREAIKGERS